MLFISFLIYLQVFVSSSDEFD